jgi:hypothetical protein
MDANGVGGITAAIRQIADGRNQIFAWVELRALSVRVALVFILASTRVFAGTSLSAQSVRSTATVIDKAGVDLSADRSITSVANLANTVV